MKIFRQLKAATTQQSVKIGNKKFSSRQKKFYGRTTIWSFQGNSIFMSTKSWKGFVWIFQMKESAMNF